MLGSQGIRAAAAVAAVFIASFSPASFAQDAEPEADAGKAVWQAAIAAMVHGPNTVQLKDQAQLALPAGYGFVPPKEGAAVMDTMGNQTDERFVGLIFPEAEESNWFVTVDYEPSGYIKDDDAKDWNAEELLDNLKEGTEAGNEHRRDIGVADPMSLLVDTHGTSNIDEGKLEKVLPELFRLTPTNIRRTLKLNRPIYRRTAAYGHFGRAAEKDGGFSWEKTDLVGQLKSAFR